MTDGNRTNWSDFDEYLRQGEPDTQAKASNWQTAIGLQAVDGLQPSDYLLKAAKQHIEGDIDIDQVQLLLKTYYQNQTTRTAGNDEKEEADLTSVNIAKILSRKTLAFNTNGYIAVHRQIFDGVFKHAGQLRTYDITKKEWVLRGDTVNYLNFEDLRRAIDYDIEQEKQFDYKGLTMVEVVEHIARFVSGLWQIHAFREGNTRTTAVFAIQYLRSIGFEINNELFARHSWYFRNALVRANYRNIQLGINYDFSFLIKFFRNLLMGENHELRNRFMVINQPDGWTEQQATPQVPLKYPPSAPQVKELVLACGEDYMTTTEMMEAVGIKDRKHFRERYLLPAIAEGVVEQKYPDSPRHPRQQYRLTDVAKAWKEGVNQKDVSL